MAWSKLKIAIVAVLAVYVVMAIVLWANLIDLWTNCNKTDPSQNNRCVDYPCDYDEQCKSNYCRVKDGKCKESTIQVIGEFMIAIPILICAGFIIQKCKGEEQDNATEVRTKRYLLVPLDDD
ncbi:hypothetical protein FGO68_gene10587 [Halteria grandinella]|uniref:Transmembrane protein n=1 Tax=Halteria grandinella TaxID=5974 RepID=A0A8J8NGG9_HALGN|nr:hypothetical protein FGO68_gene10587 [Halteria grandinella]